MKSKTVKIMTICTVSVLLLGVVLSFAVRNSYRSPEIAKIEHTDDLRDLSIKLSFAWGMDGDKKIVSQLSNHADTMIEELKNADGIYIVEPTGRIEQYSGSFSQVVRIVQVIKPADERISKEDEIPIFQHGGFSERNGQIEYSRESNMMYPGNQYLVFVSASEVNAVSEKKSFYFWESYFSCVKLTNRDKQKVCNDLEFHSLMDTTHFCTSEEILSAFVLLENKIIETFLPEEGFSALIDITSFL